MQPYGVLSFQAAIAARLSCMGLGMPDYRLYLFERTGRIGRAVEFACRDDAAAEQRCQDYADGTTHELWERGRLVRRYSPRPPGDPSVEGQAPSP